MTPAEITSKTIEVKVDKNGVHDQGITTPAARTSRCVMALGASVLILLSMSVISIFFISQQGYQMQASSMLRTSETTHELEAHDHAPVATSSTRAIGMLHPKMSMTELNSLEEVIIRHEIMDGAMEATSFLKVLSSHKITCKEDSARSCSPGDEQIMISTNQCDLLIFYSNGDEFMPSQAVVGTPTGSCAKMLAGEVYVRPSAQHADSLTHVDSAFAINGRANLVMQAGAMSDAQTAIEVAHEVSLALNERSNNRKLDADAAVAKTAAIKNIQKALTARILKRLDDGQPLVEVARKMKAIEGMQPQINDMERRLGIMQSVEPVLENAIKTLQKVVDVRGMG